MTLTLYVLGTLFWIYMFVFFHRYQIETRMSFAGIGKKRDTNYHQYGFEEILMKHPKVGEIHGIYYERNKIQTIYFFHGNDGPIGDYIYYISYLGNLGYNVMCFDYPWYGASSGFPYEENIYLSSEIFYEYLAQKKHLDYNNIITFWHSIGSVFALDFSKKYPTNKTILIAPMLSRFDISYARYKIILQKLFFIKNSFENLKKSKYIEQPVMIIHGTNDRVIPYTHGWKLYENFWSKNKNFITLDSYGHSSILQTFEAQLTPLFHEFLDGGEIGHLTLSSYIWK